MGYDNKNVSLDVKKAEDLISQIEALGITNDTLITFRGVFFQNVGMIIINQKPENC